MACGGDRRWLRWAWSSLPDPIEPEGLWIFEVDELAIVRNSVFARYGRPFSSAAMRRAFEADAPLKQLYTRDDTYTDDRLSAIDLGNIALIAAYEGARKAGAEHSEAVAAARATSPLSKSAAPAPKTTETEVR